jgi:hypothetical protein
MAEALEIAAKSGDFARVMAGNETFIGKAEDLMAQLASLAESADGVESGADSGRQAKPSPDRPLLERMLEASRSYDIDAMQSVMDELEQYKYESGGELISQLKEQVLNFGYEEISAKLEEALR